jgi:hypothetical protein
MKFKVMTLIAALAMVTGAASVSASDERNGNLHVTKECSAYFGLAGQYCTITSSNLTAIPGGTKVYYDQAFGIPAGNLDSNVLLYAGTGDWATGRCTVEAATLRGLCTFSDGIGQLAGFHARVNVRIDGLTGITYWDGTFSFTQVDNLRG